MREQEHTRTGGQQVSGSRCLAFIRPKGQTKRFFAMTILFILLFTVTVQIGTSATISVEPLYKRVPAGEHFTLNITVDPEGNQVSGLQYKLHFNNTVVNATVQTKGTFLSQDGISTSVLENEINNSIGMVSYAEYRMGVDYGVTGPGIAATVIFEAIKPGMSTLILTDVILSDPDAKSIPTTILNGWVDVVSSTPSPFLVSGYVFFENGSECLNPDVTITNQNLSTDWNANVSESSNYYEYNLTHPFEVMPGDILRFDALTRDRRYLKSATHTVTEEEIGNGRMIFNITLQQRIIRDVTVSTAYYPEGNGIKILDAGGGIVTQLEIGELYYIRYEVVNEGEQGELVNVTAKISNAGWCSNIATHDWFITSGNSIVAPPPPIGDCLNTSGLAPAYYNLAVKASIREDHNPDFHPEDNERVRHVPIGISDTEAPVVTNPTANPHIIPDDTDNDPKWGEKSTLNVTVTDEGDITHVTVNLSVIGSSPNQPMINIEGNIWSVTTNATAGAAGWNATANAYVPYQLQVNASDAHGNANTDISINLTVVKNGDVNEDGRVTAYDAMYIFKWYLHKPGFSEIKKPVADVSGDGSVTAYDAMYLFKWYLHKPGFNVLK